MSKRTKMPTGIYKRTEKCIKSLKESHLGQSPWNKGKKCPQLSGENNGMFGVRRLGVEHPLFGKHRSEETKRKIKLTNIEKGIKPTKIYIKYGKENHAWKGGKGSENHKIRNSIEYRLWRESVFARDNWNCQRCFIRGGELEAHHIKPFAIFPELRFAIDNGQTLCEKCHKVIHKTIFIGRNKNGIRKLDLEYI